MSRFWENSPWEEGETNRQSEQEYEPNFTQGSWYNIPHPDGETSHEPSNYYKATPNPKSAKQQKKEEKAEKKADRRKKRQDTCREQSSLKHIDRWAYLKMWQAADRAAYGTAYDEFSASAEVFFADHTKGFPRLKKHGCKRKNCVKATLLGVCHHEIEATLRGSGRMDEKMIKKERLRWHPDRWVGKQEVQVKCNELFQLIQRIVDGDIQSET
ncbi:hypothetical protein EYC80_002210 [Monilinia laxa]|uniref:Uncharacterized protein n=1 Tax=Monilinia laxa TaxID=61186 RepID=A0A5N6K3B2_MONLA|nr:hypothetical protein EYC80_002210 [Monilinia laxa]